MAKKITLDDIFAEDDEMGLLNVKPKGTGAGSDDERVRSAFEEINDFIDRMGHAPGAGPRGLRPSMIERSLQARLQTYLERPELADSLAALDRHGLLRAAAPASAPSLDEILDSGDALLDDPAASIFRFSQARPPAARPDKVSERVPCTNFEDFRPLFDRAAAELASGARRSMRFAQEQEIEAGGFFILNGVLVYVAEVNDPHVRGGKRNARLRLIFDNGLEGQNLARSLAAELYKDPNGRRLSDPNAGPLFGEPQAATLVAPPAERTTGIVYVLRSMSPLPEIARLDGSLFKIGFTSGPLTARIRAAKDDPTFLMAAVHPVRSFEAVNMSAERFERLLHWFFADACLDIDIRDALGNVYKPREWFVLPLPIIEQAIPMMLDGSVARHRYDHRLASIVATDASPIASGQISSISRG